MVTSVTGPRETLVREGRAMERPTILLAVTGDIDGYVGALQRAGFEPVTIDATELEMAPRVDLAVLDCDLAEAAVTAVYSYLHQGEASIATLLLVGHAT